MHGIELEDLPWFPARLRRMQMRFIGWLVATLSLYEEAANWLKHQDLKPSLLVDLCSGTGQPALQFALQARISDIILTDKYPVEGMKHYLQEPVDVTETLPAYEGAVYTMFNAFHHFTAQEQEAILAKLSATKSPIIICEILRPSVLDALKIAFTTTIGQILLTPFIRPVRWDQWLFTYLIPLNLITISWDGIVSVIRSKNPSEYEVMLAHQNPTNYQWEVHDLKTKWPLTRLTMIIGLPIHK